MLVDDACGRRDLFGGPAGLREPAVPVPNAALKTPPDEFRYQLEHCGSAIVTADHATTHPAEAERFVTRLIVTAYSPAIAFEGSTAAARLMQSAGGEPPAPAPRGADPSQPAL